MYQSGRMLFFKNRGEAAYQLADERVCLHQVSGFYQGISTFYQEFSRVTDQEVLELLRKHSSAESRDNQLTNR